MASAVPDEYRHYSKQTVPRGVADVAGAWIKLYHLERPGEPVPDTVHAMAMLRLAELAGDLKPSDCGFAIVHRCGADFHFLLPTLWRGANEAWEAVEYQQGTMPGFAPFNPAYPTVQAGLRPTFCVWELAIVAHEALAWTRFLNSNRDAVALAVWRADVLSGPA